MKRAAPDTVDAVLEKKGKTKRILHIVLSVFKSFLLLSALIMIVCAIFLAQADESQQSLLVMFLIFLSILFTFAGALLTFVSLLINITGTHLFSALWNWITLAGLLFFIAFCVLYGILGDAVTWLFFVGLPLLCVPSGFEFAAFLRCQSQKRLSSDDK